MKKVFAFIAAAVLALTMFAGCDSGSSNGGKFVLGLDDSFPPMGYRDDDNNIVGFDIDLAAAVCEELGLELVLQPIDWDNKETELESGNIDCIWNGMSTNPEREEKMCMSKPYMENHMVAVVAKGSELTTRESLADKKVGAQKASSGLEAAEDDEFISQAEIIQYDNNVLALSDLPTGRIDAVVLDEVVANYMIKDDQDKYEVLSDTLTSEFYAIGFKKGNDELKNKVEGAIKTLIENGKAKEISEKWFGKEVLLDF